MDEWNKLMFLSLSFSPPSTSSLFLKSINRKKYINHPKTRYLATREYFYSLKPEKIVQTLYPSLPFISCRNPNKGSGLNVSPIPLSSAPWPEPGSSLGSVTCVMPRAPRTLTILNLVFLSLSCIPFCGHPCLTITWKNTGHGYILAVESTDFLVDRIWTKRAGKNDSKVSD